MTEVIKVWYEGRELELPRERCWLVDRSRVLRGESCPQKRRLEYEAGPAGRGVQPARRSEDLALGSAVHAGLEEMLMSWGREYPVESSFNQMVEHCAQIAYDSMMESYTGGLAMQDDEQFTTVMPEVARLLAEEQAALAYGLVWTFGRRRLAALLERYEVVAVEPEVNWLVGWQDRKTFDEVNMAIVMMSRPDAILRSRDDGKLWTVSWKTTKRFDPTSVERLECDIQTLTEGLAVQHRYGVQPGGAYYGYFIKGDRWKDSELGVKRYTSELVRPWHSEGMFGTGAWKARYETYDLASGKTVRLGRQWRRADVWTQMPMAEWLGMLDGGEVQAEAGRDWLEEVVAEPLPVRFSAELAAEWVRTRVQEEARWMDLGVERVKHSQSCFSYNKTCAFFSCCWRGDTVENNLLSGRFSIRTANHEVEQGD